MFVENQELKNSTLFNENQKIEFIKSLSKDVKSEKDALSKTQIWTRNRISFLSSKIEIPLNKDFSDMSQQELFNGLKSIEYGAYSTIRIDKTLIKNYLMWLKDFKRVEIIKINIDAIDVHSVGIESFMKKNLFPDLAEMFCYMKENCYQIGDEVSVLMSLFWMGLTMEQVINLTSDDVNLVNATICIKDTNELIQIPNLILKVLAQYESLDFYSNRKDDNFKTYVYKANSNMYVKGFFFETSNTEIKDLKSFCIFKLSNFTRRCNNINKNKRVITSTYLILNGKLARLNDIKNKNGEITDYDIKKVFSINEQTNKNVFEIKDIMEMCNSFNRIFYS